MSKIRGLILGAAGGVAGVALMGPAYRLTAKLTHQSLPSDEDATEKVANAVAIKLTGRKLGRSQKKTGGQIVQFIFGAGMGAFYGLLADSFPALTGAGGALLGTSLYLGAHAITVPALGLAPSPIREGPVRESPEFAAHLVYGFVTETVRKILS